MERFTVVYDQQCGICLACVAWLQQRDPRRQMLFVGNQASQLPASVDRAQAVNTIYVVDQSTGSTRTHADAIALLLRALPGRRTAGFRIVGFLMTLPLLRQLANLGYRRVAKHRQRISTALGLTACAIPPAHNDPTPH